MNVHRPPPFLNSPTMIEGLSRSLFVYRPDHSLEDRSVPLFFFCKLLPLRAGPQVHVLSPPSDTVINPIARPPVEFQGAIFPSLPGTLKTRWSHRRHSSSPVSVMFNRPFAGLHLYRASLFVSHNE